MILLENAIVIARLLHLYVFTNGCGTRFTHTNCFVLITTTNIYVRFRCTTTMYVTTSVDCVLIIYVIS